MIRATKRKAALCAAFLLLTGGSQVIAGMVGVSPLRVDFDAATQTSIVTVFNTGDDDISMQVDVRSWQQASDGQDQYDSTGEVLAVPPIFTLAPGEKQVVRIGMLTEQSPDREQAWRLFLTELPPPLDESTKGHLRMRLIVSLPIFSAPVVAEARSNLTLVETERDGDRMRARFHNPGNSHIRVAEVTAMNAAGKPAVQLERPAYLLPGATRDYFFDLNEDVTRLVAVTDTVGTVEYEVPTP